MEETKPRAAILYALQLAVDPYIASFNIRTLTHKTSHLLLADDPHIVHMALSALSNPLLAAMLDEKCCEMILLALHQSLEPSVQIVAAKLLTHLATPHKGIVQPLAWNHIRQSLGLMEFLSSLEPSRAIVEACIISNLLPALPVHVRQRYVGAVKELILVGLERPQEGQTLSLIFQGLANLARFDSWAKSQQTQLAVDLFATVAQPGGELLGRREQLAGMGGVQQPGGGGARPPGVTVQQRGPGLRLELGDHPARVGLVHADASGSRAESPAVDDGEEQGQGLQVRKRIGHIRSVCPRREVLSTGPPGPVER